MGCDALARRFVGEAATLAAGLSGLGAGSSVRIFRPRVVRSMTISAVFSNFQLCKGRRFTLHILLGFTVNLQYLAFYLGHGLLHFLSQRGVIKNNLHISPDHKVAAS
jgi:hypothetical protein